MLSQSAKHEGGWRILKLKTKSEIFLIQHKQQRIASHPEALQYGWKYLSRDFLRRKPQPEATPNPNC